MSEKKTSIETGDWWTKASCPWTGCPRLALRPCDRSAGCTRCWLPAYLKRFPALHWGNRPKTPGWEALARASVDAGEVLTHPNRLAACLRGPAQRFGWILGEPPWDSPEFLAAAVGVALARPDCGFGVPTSDPGKAVAWARWIMRGDLPMPTFNCISAASFHGVEIKRIDHQLQWPPPNWIWLISASTQAELDARAPHAANLHAMGWRVGLHLEPLLGPVMFHASTLDQPMYAQPFASAVLRHQDDPMRHKVWSWIVSGAPNGHNCTEAELDLHRSIRDQAVAAGVPYWGKNYGPKRGRVLDGRTWDQLPAGWPGIGEVP